ncbi:MAG: hypothetical protein IPM70_06370 [Proteobacteria bacterium]|jgi:hypothetical protein|nr:hypothetical protein [Pseudomonadota bacterium]MBK9251534.1 hypothetical protein [Pseudomonadota bacterium]MCC6633035.1 hypothetical protein [Gammaproteobacteria bacterium]
MHPLKSPLALLAPLAMLLAACNSVRVAPEGQLPKALVQPMKAHVGLVLDDELRAFKHEETRSSAEWAVDLGPGHEQLLKAVFGASFSTVEVFRNFDEARAATGLQGVFSPRIEQYSFATARETGGTYWAVTIRYRIGVFTPQGEPADSLTLTGYGSAGDAGRAAPSLVNATRAAMRDAAAKLLVQMPRQPVAQKLVAGEILRAGESTVMVDPIETVPIEAVATPPAG